MVRVTISPEDVHVLICESSPQNKREFKVADGITVANRLTLIRLDWAHPGNPGLKEGDKRRDLEETQLSVVLKREEGATAKGCRCPLEAGKGENTVSPPSLQKGRSPASTFTLKVCPLRPFGLQSGRAARC